MKIQKLHLFYICIPYLLLVNLMKGENEISEYYNSKQMVILSYPSTHNNGQLTKGFVLA